MIRMRLNEKRMPEQTEREIKERKRKRKEEREGKTEWWTDPIGSNYLPTAAMRYDRDKRKSKSKKGKKQVKGKSEHSRPGAIHYHISTFETSVRWGRTT